MYHRVSNSLQFIIYQATKTNSNHMLIMGMQLLYMYRLIIFYSNLQDMRVSQIMCVYTNSLSCVGNRLMELSDWNGSKSNEINQMALLRIQTKI